MTPPRPPFHPIIYVRGYAMTPSEIEQTVATPYMGFNLGATKVRQNARGDVVRHIFESPLVRLMKDYGYRDNYSDGAELTGPLPERCVVIYRYYESADPALGQGKTLTITEAADGLGRLILNLRDSYCSTQPERDAFKVHLVAHSMGGLIVRCLLQNEQIASPAVRAAVDKVFTYATPHNGIEMAGVNVPAFLSLWDISNFNREHIAKDLALTAAPDGRVDSLDDKFPPDRFFCLVGTNHQDYAVAWGMSRRLAGEMSDGLVRIENATVRNAPRAFTFRSHSGPYGIVNSESGYQNLVRFLFGDIRIDARLHLEKLPLPPSVQDKLEAGKKVEAAYYFEATVAPRGALAYRLSERRRETFSAVLRPFDALFSNRDTPRPDARSPHLFSAFLDTRKITSGRTLVFSLELTVSTTGYEVDGFLFLDQHVPGEFLYRNTLTLRATATDDGGWRLRWNDSDDQWGEKRGREAEGDGSPWRIPLSTRKGFQATLELTARPWS